MATTGAANNKTLYIVGGVVGLILLAILIWYFFIRAKVECPATGTSNVADPNNTSKYYTCTSGKATGPFQCEGTQIFDAATGGCKEPESTRRR